MTELGSDPWKDHALTERMTDSAALVAQATGPATEAPAAVEPADDPSTSEPPAPVAGPAAVHPRNRNWPPPAPSVAAGRRFGAGAFVLAVAISVVVAGAAGGAAGYLIRGGTSDNTASSSGTAGITSPAVTVAPVDAGSVLLSRIVPAPTGSVMIQLPDATNGVLTLRQDVLQFFPSAPLQADTLRADGFVASAATEYKRPDGVAVLTHLTSFATAAGARDYAGARKAVWVATANVSGSFDVPGGGIGFEQDKPDAAGRRLTVMYEQVGTIVVAIDVYTSGAPDRQANLTTMAAQVAKAR